jgi:Pyruvate/2-oxoacid:ferredoxin oxidoreductase delta subunit
MTKYCVELVRHELEKQNVSINIFNIEDIKIQDIPLDTYDLLGIAYPVHSFNAPQIVIKFANNLPKVKSINTFIISTIGDNSKLNLDSSRLLMCTLGKKGFNVFYNRHFLMPCNFIRKDSDNDVTSKISNIKEEIPITVNEIINHKISKQKSTVVTKAIAIIGRVEWNGAKMLGRFFRTDKKCDRCGLCVNNCPNRNIIINKKRIHFKWNCGLCMKCIYLCPKKSITVPQPFKFIVLDSWYKNDEFSFIKGSWK